MVERFHKTIKETLYCLYSDDKEKFDIKECLETVLKKYNNHKHTTTKFCPNMIFYSKDEDFLDKVLDNIKNSFKNIGTIERNFIDEEKCLMKKSFKIKKKFKENSIVIIINDNIKKKTSFGKINVTVVSKIGINYKIRIEKDYEDCNVFKNEIYIVDNLLLNKCSLNVWNKLLKKMKLNWKIF